jgi:hypothetical protein
LIFSLTILLTKILRMERKHNVAHEPLPTKEAIDA